MRRSRRTALSQGISHLAVEEPCWPQVRAAAVVAGVTAIPVPVDEHGLSVAELAAQPQIRAVCLLGSVSKTLAPAVGIGWIVTPPRFTQALRDATPIPLVPPALHQLALASPWSSATETSRTRPWTKPLPSSPG